MVKKVVRPVINKSSNINLIQEDHGFYGGVEQCFEKYKKFKLLSLGENKTDEKNDVLIAYQQNFLAELHERISLKSNLESILLEGMTSRMMGYVDEVTQSSLMFVLFYKICWELKEKNRLKNNYFIELCSLPQTQHHFLVISLDADSVALNGNAYRLEQRNEHQLLILDFINNPDEPIQFSNYVDWLNKHEQSHGSVVRKLTIRLDDLVTSQSVDRFNYLLNQVTNRYPHWYEQQEQKHLVLKSCAQQLAYKKAPAKEVEKFFLFQSCASIAMRKKRPQEEIDQVLTDLTMHEPTASAKNALYGPPKNKGLISPISLKRTIPVDTGAKNTNSTLNRRVQLERRDSHLEAPLAKPEELSDEESDR
jgi:hypothetical protein